MDATQKKVQHTCLGFFPQDYVEWNSIIFYTISCSYFRIKKVILPFKIEGHQYQNGGGPTPDIPDNPLI